MKKRYVALLAIFAVLFGAAFVSCDFDDDDDTEIVVKNESYSFILGETDYITHITVNRMGGRVAFDGNVDIAPGGWRTFSLDEGLYSVSIWVQTKDASGGNKGSRMYYSTGTRAVEEGDSLDAVYSNKGFAFD